VLFQIAVELLDQLLYDVLFKESMALLVVMASTGREDVPLVERELVDVVEMLYVALAEAVLFADHELDTELVGKLKNGAEVTVAFMNELTVVLNDVLVVALETDVAFKKGAEVSVPFIEMLAVALAITVAFMNGADVSVTLSEILAVALDMDVALIGRLVIVTLANGAFGRVELVELVELFGIIRGNFGGRVLLHSVRLPMLFTPSKLNRMYA
jgi:hypothetical protein